ncbi:unnamed protein product [Mycena citricolor]|uniref:Uncharacterized protein n=1 Tax=Mycena citricolor TaxID=2018698 RepID=A0AAD2HYD8_9AGAR|nr:unnamed protein product [Mycena citricolor]
MSGSEDARGPKLIAAGQSALGRAQPEHPMMLTMELLSASIGGIHFLEVASSQRSHRPGVLIAQRSLRPRGSLRLQLAAQGSLGLRSWSAAANLPQPHTRPKQDGSRSFALLVYEETP